MRISSLILLTLGLFACTQDAAAQYNYQRPSNRPFDNITRAPTVSPYLMLTNSGSGLNSFDGFNSSAARYQTMVRPMLQQRAQNSRVENQLRGLENQVQQYQSTAIGGVSTTTQMGFETQGLTTGHQSLFQYHSRFYPGLRRR